MLTLQTVSVVLSFSTAVILARLLEVGGYGAYAYGIAWASLLGVPAVLGLDRLIVRDVATHVAEEKWSLIRGLLQRANQIVFLVSTSVAIVLAGVGLALLRDPVDKTFAIGMILVPLTALTLLRQAALQGLSRPLLSQLPELLLKPLTMTVVLGALWLLAGTRLSPMAGMTINVVITALAFAVGTILLRRNIPLIAKTTTVAFHTRRWMSTAVPMMIISGIWIVNGYVGTIMLGSLVDARSAGIYAVASRGADIVIIALLAVNIPLAPRLARLYAAGDHEALQRLVSAVAKWTFLASLPLAIGLFLLRDVYLGLFGPGFSAGGSALAILIGGQLLNVASGPVGILLLMTGYERWAALGVACGTVLNIAVNVALNPFLGVPGAAIGALTSIACWNFLLVVFTIRRLRIYPTVFGAQFSAFGR